MAEKVTKIGIPIYNMGVQVNQGVMHLTDMVQLLLDANGCRVALKMKCVFWISSHFRWKEMAENAFRSV